MLRVGNLQRSIDFYTKVMGMTLLKTTENTEYKYSLAFVGYGSNPDHAELELTFNWGVESYDMGTAYGHLAIAVPDAYAACEKIRNDRGAAFDWASFTRHFAAGIANFFAGCISIWHGNGQMTVGGAHVIRLYAPVEGEFEFCMIGVAAVTHKSQ